MEISLESVESHAVPHNILPNHTEGHRLNGRDALSGKAGSRLGKDSAGVGVKNLLGQSSLKYCRRRGLNRCPLAWELGTLPLDQLDLFPCFVSRLSINRASMDFPGPWDKVSLLGVEALCGYFTLIPGTFIVQRVLCLRCF